MALPYKLQDLARLYPEAQLIMGHRGWDFHFDVIYVEQTCPGLWIETSKCEYVDLEHSYRMGNAHRLLFGSDYPISSMASELSKVRRLVGLTSEHKSAILAELRAPIQDGNRCLNGYASRSIGTSAAGACRV